MRKLSVLRAGKLGTELETVRRWNVTAVARKDISRENAMQRKEVSGGRKKKQVKRKRKWQQNRKQGDGE